MVRHASVVGLLTWIDAHRVESRTPPLVTPVRPSILVSEILAVKTGERKSTGN